LEFTKKEGLGPKTGLTAEALMLGRGYTVEGTRLVALYDRYVSNTCDEIFPFSAGEATMTKGPSGFVLKGGKDSGKEGSSIAEEEWLMPNLANLPIRSAIEKLAVHTSHIRIIGNGQVTSQFPRPFERLKGEPECVIQGRTGYE
jgi:hypothetical protein